MKLSDSRRAVFGAAAVVLAFVNFAALSGCMGPLGSDVVRTTEPSTIDLGNDPVVPANDTPPVDPSVEPPPTVASVGPTADAGADQSVAEAALVTLDGSNSQSASGGALQFAWSQFAGPIVSLDGAGTVSPTFTVPNAGAEPIELAFELIVTDAGLSSSDTVMVTVTPIEPAPADAGECTIDADCDDSLFCNGVEVCSAGACIAGASPCTVGQTCNEASDFCEVVTPPGGCSVDADCDDGLYCNGVEICVGGACSAGTSPNCDDGVSCTVDSCDEVNEACTHVASDALCDNGLFCDGVETCVAATGCESSGGPCNHLLCDESTDSCIVVSCTIDSDCDDNVFCNGVERCVANACVSGTVVDCSDGIACTNDSCNEAIDACAHLPNDSLCDNGVYCDGAEVCDAVNGCLSASPIDCSDSALCTVDTCNEATNSCDHTPDHSFCDDGVFCNGSEACVGGACVGGSAPCISGQTCNESTSVCEGTGNASAMATASRTSGPAPFGVFFDATETASGVVQPTAVNGRRDYSTFRYEWQFDDDSSAVWVGTGTSKNVQTGHLSAHVFETAGVYSVLLRVTDASGGVRDYSQTITVSEAEVVFGNASNSSGGSTIYVAPSGSDSANGSFNSPVRTADEGFSRLFASDGPGRLLFQRGGMYPTAGFRVGLFSGPYLVSSYGNTSSAAPVIQGTGGNAIFSAAAGDDLTFAGLDFTSFYNPVDGFGIHPDVISMLGDNSHITIYQNTFSNAGLMMHLGQLGTWTDCIIADNVVRDWQNYGVLTGALDRVAFVGNSIKQHRGAACCDLKSPTPPEPDFADHGPLRLRTMNKTLVTANDLFSNSGWGSSRAAIQPCLRLGSGGFADLSIASFNTMEGGTILAGSGPSNDMTSAQVGNIIFEGNTLLGGDSTRSFVGTNMGGYVIRNNLFVQADGGDRMLRVVYFESHAIMDPVSVSLMNRVYNNTYVSLETGPDTGFFVDVDPGALTNIDVRNNIWYAPNAGPSNTAFYRWNQSDMSGLVSDHNIYYSPTANSFVNLNGAGVSLTEWRSTYGHGANSVREDPLFLDVSTEDYCFETVDGGFPVDSLAVDSGAALTSVRVDITGVLRPSGGAWDIGAYECGVAAAASVCGNGTMETGEQCDDGGANSDVVANACRTDCMSARCGDGVVDGGEACDDGGTVSGDGCSATCQTEGSVSARFWIGGTGNWSDTAHWSLSSGGSPGASAPSSSEDAVFDAQSGSGVVTADGTVRVRDLIIQADAASALTLSLNSQTVECLRDCLLLSGGIDEGAPGTATLIAGRNLDTVNCILGTNGTGTGMSVHLVGTGTWHYSLGTSGSPRPFQPHIWDLLAAQNGQTTTLRPVGAAPTGIDIDVWHQVLLGGPTGLLQADLQDADFGGVVTLEIHSNGLDIISSGASVDITNIEHELSGSGPGVLQSDVNIVNLRTFDVTGLSGQPAGLGSTWLLNGPKDFGPASISIEKTAVIDTAGFDLQAANIDIGNGNAGVGELYVRGARVTVSSRLAVGAKTGDSGRLHLGTGSVVAVHLESFESGGFITGEQGSFVELTGSVAATGTIVYVSSSNPARSDSGPGTQAQPLASFAAAVQRLAPGVTVLFQRGDTWSAANGMTLDIAGGTVGAFGVGARPVVTLLAGGTLNVDDNAATPGSVYDLRLEFGG